MNQYQVLQEVLDRTADMAIWMEDEPSAHLGKSYSVNLNFRRDGQRLYVSVESYGTEHCGRSEEYVIPLLRKARVRSQIVAWCMIGLAAAMAVALIILG